MTNFEGPRAAKLEEVEGLKQLNVACFPHPPLNLNNAFLMFSPEQLEYQRIFLADGKPVAHVGVGVQEAEIFSCPVKVAMVGGVGTHPDFRGQSLSGRLLDDTWQKLRSDGVDFALISGSRSLYWRAGCAPCRPSHVFAVTPEAKFREKEIKEDPLACLQAIEQIYQKEPVRFHRSSAMLRDILQGRPVGLRPLMPVAEQMVFALVEGQSYLVGLKEGEETPYIRVVEYAGERNLLASAASALAARWGLPLHFEVPFWEESFRAALAAVGKEIEFTTASGTVKILNLPQLMEKLRPLWERGLGAGQSAIAFSQSGDEAKFSLGAGQLTLQGQTLGELVFGTTETRFWAADQAELAEALQNIFPLPGLRYDLDYI